MLNATCSPCRYVFAHKTTSPCTHSSRTPQIWPRSSNFPQFNVLDLTTFIAVLCLGGDTLRWGTQIGRGKAKEISTSIERSDRVLSSDMKMLRSSSQSSDGFQPPHIFSPQDPVTSLQEDGNAPFYDTLTTDSSRLSDLPSERGHATLITWSHGGNNVEVVGSWDNWTSRRALQRMADDHFIILDLPYGLNRCKFIVDGKWSYMPDLPHVPDEMGGMINMLDVKEDTPDYVDHITELEEPPSPVSSYGQVLPMDEDFSKDPPLLPDHLPTWLNQKYSQSASGRPERITLEHLFVEKRQASDPVIAVSQTHRYKSKYVNVVLYTDPTKRKMVAKINQ